MYLFVYLFILWFPHPSQECMLYDSSDYKNDFIGLPNFHSSPGNGPLIHDLGNTPKYDF